LEHLYFQAPDFQYDLGRPWLARWISPDSAGAVDGLNLYVYVNNNPLKYTDPTGHGINTISKTTTVVSFFTCVAVAFLLGLGFVFASNDSSATIRIIMFVAEGLNFVIRQGMVSIQYPMMIFFKG
jgi:hypothetical protein